MAELLITGGSGFVGKNLIPYLENKGHSVSRLSLRGNWLATLPPTFDAVIHLAGKAHDTKNTSDDAAYFAVNTELTKELFRVFIRSNARDFIYFSSVKAAADTVAGTLDEDHIPSPGTPYGLSKQQAEAFLLATPLPPGKRVFIIRPCMIHGPGNKGNLNLLYKFVAKGIPYPLAAFENKRSFLGIDNLCFVLAALLADPGIPSGIYNLADDEALSTNEVVRSIAAALHKKAKLWSLPKGILKAVAGLGSMLHLPLNRERLKKLTENYVVSNKKIKDALGMTGLPVSAREGLRKTIESFVSK